MKCEHAKLHPFLHAAITGDLRQDVMNLTAAHEDILDLGYFPGDSFAAKSQRNHSDQISLLTIYIDNPER